MKFLLLLIFFSTPPSTIQPKEKNTPADHRIWTVSSSTTIEIIGEAWCDAVKQHAIDAINKTDTMKAVGTCISESDPGEDDVAVMEVKPKKGARLKPKFKFSDH